MFKIAFLASTRGSNFQSFIDAKAVGGFEPEIVCLVTDTPGCGAVEKARSANIPVHELNPAGKAKNEFDQELIEVLESYAPDLIVLGGYMRLLGPVFVRHFEGKIVNIHPSLLPKYPGLHTHERVLKAGGKESGMTIHLVDEGMDTGPILLQKSVAIEPGETPESLKAKVQQLEKEWYPKVVADLAKKLK